MAAKLDQYCRATGRSMKAAVNELLRLGLNAPRASARQAPYSVSARPLRARPGIDLDNIEELLEQIDGPAHK